MSEFPKDGIFGAPAPPHGDRCDHNFNAEGWCLDCGDRQPAPHGDREPRPRFSGEQLRQRLHLKDVSGSVIKQVVNDAIVVRELMSLDRDAEDALVFQKPEHLSQVISQILALIHRAKGKP